ncbi:18402_t:CDS:2, partial [Gigaspora rosea]
MKPGHNSETENSETENSEEFAYNEAVKNKNTASIIERLCKRDSNKPIIHLIWKTQSALKNKKTAT